MSDALAPPRPSADPKDQRQHPRVALKVAGRYMLSNGEEFACDTVDVSAGGLAINAIKNGRPGERVVIYLHDLGRIEGRVVRRLPGQLAIEIVASQHKRDRITERIRWLMKRESGEVEDRRAAAREDVETSEIILRTEDNREFPAELIELSLLGAHIKVDVPLRVGARVMLGEKEAVVARSTADSVALRFAQKA